MEGITLLVSIILIVFGVLQIILFFKLWGMTNDVKKMKKHFLPSDSNNCSLKGEDTPIGQHSDIQAVGMGNNSDSRNRPYSSIGIFGYLKHRILPNSY